MDEAFRTRIVMSCVDAGRPDLVPIEAFLTEKRLFELAHGAPIPMDAPITTPSGKMHLRWNAWSAISEPEVLAGLGEWALEQVSAKGWQYDTVCSMSVSGLPIATLLAVGHRKPLVACDNVSGRFYPRDPREGERLLLVDSVVVTGVHLDTVQKQIGECGAELAGLVVISHQDVTGPIPLAFDELMESGRVLSFTTFSEALDVWRTQNVEAGAPTSGEASIPA